MQTWQKAHCLALKAYALSADFPKTEMFGLTTQMRRAAVSVAANIVEGCSRGGDGMFGNDLKIARGSAGELEYYGILASELGLLTSEAGRGLSRDAAEVKRMLTGLLKVVEAKER